MLCCLAYSDQNNMSHPCQEYMEVHQKHSLGLFRGFDCGFLLLLLLLKCFSRPLVFMMMSKDVPIPVINIPFGIEENINLN